MTSWRSTLSCEVDVERWHRVYVKAYYETELLLYLNVSWRGEFRGEAGVSVGEIGVDNVADLCSQFVYLLHGLRYIISRKVEQRGRFGVYLRSHKMLCTK